MTIVICVCVSDERNEDRQPDDPSEHPKDNRKDTLRAVVAGAAVDTGLAGQ